ncbi:MAG: protein kinase [Planctomycetes bacterium]|nr:protein kinase [Planctomycetota bacterium]
MIRPLPAGAATRHSPLPDPPPPSPVPLTDDAVAEFKALVARGRHYDALARAARRRGDQGSVAGLETAFEELDRRPGTDLAPSDRRTLLRLLGDAHRLLLRLEPAIRRFAEANDTSELERLLRLAIDLGRYRAVKLLLELLPAPAELREDGYRRFLLERALPSVPIGGDAQGGFWIDEAMVHEIAAELGEPPAPLLARTCRWMLERGSRHFAKLLVFARLSGDAQLLKSMDACLTERAQRPRARLRQLLAGEVQGGGGELLDTLQEGDADNYNPKSAWLFAAVLDRRRVVLKEHLRLPLDYVRIDPASEEKALLESLEHPAIVRCQGALHVPPHEFLVLDWLTGRCLAPHATAQQLLPRAEALRAAGRVADAVAYLHSRSIVYLDVKAKNVVFRGGGGRGSNGGVTLVDFGMARRLPAGSKTVRSLLSTPAYVPPEMARSFAAGPAADVFQLGLLTYELLVGRHPFATVDFAEGDALRESELVKFALSNLWNEPNLDTLPAAEGPGLRELVRRMLDKQPERRPTAAEVASSLRELA